MTQMDLVVQRPSLDKSVVIVGATTACAANYDQANEALSRRLLRAIISSLAGADIVATVNDADDTMLYVSIHGLTHNAHHSQMALNLSRELGLTQPGMTIEAGPASGLMALHLAMGGLRQERCKLALVVEVVLGEDDQEHLSVAILQDGREAKDRGSQPACFLNHTMMGDKAYADHDWAEASYIQCELSAGKPHLAALADLSRMGAKDPDSEAVYALSGALNGGTPVVAMIEPVLDMSLPLIEFESDCFDLDEDDCAPLFALNPFAEIDRTGEIPLLVPTDLCADGDDDGPEGRQDAFGYISPKAPMGRTWLGLRWEANRELPGFIGSLEAPEFDAV